MFQSVSAYHALLAEALHRDPRGKDIRGIIPPYFQEQRQIMSSDASPFEAMLTNPAWCVFPTEEKFTKKVYIPRGYLIDLYKLYCKDNNIAFHTPGADYESVSFQGGLWS